MKKPPRLRILISAYYCSPYRGGESAVGWRVATELAKQHDVTVICGDLAVNAPTANDHARFAESQAPVQNLSIVHVQASGVSKTLHTAHNLPGLWFLFYEAYRRWQIQALNRARELHEQSPFDIIHHITIIGFREPGYLWTLGVPFFWGPVSGAPMVPSSFLRDFSLKEKFRWGTRNVMNRWQIKHPGRSSAAAKSATKVWTVSREDLIAVQSWGVSAQALLETGCAPSSHAKQRSIRIGQPVELCWSGLFQGIKALPVVLRAIACLSTAPIKLHVLGSGSEEKSWRQVCSSLGLDNRVIWHGMVSREMALNIMNQTHALLHSSVKEGTPHVVLEALSMGIPVICHDACGMGTAVDRRCGLKIPLRDPQTSTIGFRDAIRRLLDEPDLLPRLSQGALQRAAELSWESKVEEFSKAYRAALNPSA